MKAREITFGIYDPQGKDAKAIVNGDKLEAIKLIVKVPRKWYYSMLNDAHIAFLEQYPNVKH